MDLRVADRCDRLPRAATPQAGSIAKMTEHLTPPVEANGTVGGEDVVAELEPSRATDASGDIVRLQITVSITPDEVQ